MENNITLNDKILNREKIIYLLTDVVKNLMNELGKNDDQLEFLIDTIENMKFDKINISTTSFKKIPGNVEGKKGIYMFPKHIILYIFNYLSHKDLINISVVDKKTHQIAKSNLLWQERFFKRFNKLVLTNNKPPFLKVIENVNEDIFNSNPDDFKKHLPLLSNISFKKQYFKMQSLENNWEGKNPIKNLITLSDRITNITLNSKTNEFIPVLGDGTASLYKYDSSPHYRITKIRDFEGHHGAIFCSAQYKDNLFTGSYDKTLKIWQISTGKCLHTLKPSANSWVATVCFDKDLKMLAASSWDGVIKLYDSNNDYLNTLTLSTPSNNSIYSMKTNLRENLIFTGCKFKNVDIWDIERNEKIFSKEGHSAKINSLILSKQNPNIFFTASEDKTIKMWDKRLENPVVNSFDGHLKSVTQIEFDHVNDRLISSSLDKHIKIWDVKSHKEVRSLCGHTLGVYSLAFDQTKLISGADDKDIIIWDFITPFNV